MSEVAQSIPGTVMRAPRTVDIAITAQCNLRCSYCYFFGNTEPAYQDLPTEEWVRFFDELGSLGVMSVTLAGGEPFLRPDLRELISAIVRNRMRFRLLSNGLAIDDGIAAFIAATKRCDTVQVSLDGSQPETHDSCRGAGSFDGALCGIRTLQRHRVDVTVRVTVHRHNYLDLDSIAHLLLEEISDVWREGGALKALRARVAIALASFPFCTGCDYQRYCTGNCPALAHVMIGRIDHPSPDACLMRFLADGGSVPA